jgi:glycosyltransferase involved in cell wall biosynthesis
MHFASFFTQSAFQIAAWLIALAWLFRLIEAARGLPTVPNLLDPEHNLSPAGNPSLTVIVPARNETASIAECLQSLIDQDFEALQIIAVDDRSTDHTGALMDSCAAAHPAKLTVLHIAELPDGWLGKTHAMSVAAKQAIDDHAPDYLLFTDGDIVFAPTILRRALAYTVKTNTDHLVTMPTTLAKSFGEAMLLSFMQVISNLGVRLWRVADPLARDTIGVGAFNLIRTSAYLQLGGFDAIPMEIVEDMAIAQRIKRAGFRQCAAFAPGAVAVHWAAGILGILNGLTKNIFAVFRFRPWLLLAAALGLALFCIAPICFLVAAATRIPALVTFASVAGLYVLNNRTNPISPWYAVLFPISAALIVYSMLRSMIVTLAHGGVTWRGTFYPLADLRKQTGQPRTETDEHG